ncbi:hypothetical protein TNCV_4287901 [Trichonephila clavipes]|uniref:Uncharacterized protein n=1 Tax=Trichonephila clavipes TaxID=2585209 RepID=A0A8X6VHU1_TRICX|nr:hypothetical protein TNCV_4287901 [Trichonephila clavipes]
MDQKLLCNLNYNGVQNLSNNVHFTQMALELQKKGYCDQFYQHAFFSRFMRMHMSGTKCNRRHELTHNMCGRRAQLTTTIAKEHLKIFIASVSESFSEIWLEEITWMTSHVKSDEQARKQTFAGVVTRD